MNRAWHRFAPHLFRIVLTNQSGIAIYKGNCAAPHLLESHSYIMAKLDEVVLLVALPLDANSTNDTYRHPFSDIADTWSTSSTWLYRQILEEYDLMSKLIN